MQALLRSAGIVLLLLLALSLVAGGIVEAGPNARLHGEYHFTQSRQCVNATAGFNADFSLVLPVPAGGFTNKTVHVDRGTFQYNGDGTGAVSGRSTLIRVNSGLAGNFNVARPINETEFTCTLTYTVNPDGSVDQEATCNFTIVAGDGAGNTGTVTGVKTRRQIVQGNTMLLHMPVDTPNVETVMETTPSAVTFQFDRICIRSGVTSK